MADHASEQGLKALHPSGGRAVEQVARCTPTTQADPAGDSSMKSVRSNLAVPLPSAVRLEGEAGQRELRAGGVLEDEQ